MSTTEQKIASALAQINECLYDHGAGKYGGAVSAQQRNQAFDNARFLAAELRRLSAENEALRAQVEALTRDCGRQASKIIELIADLKFQEGKHREYRARLQAIHEHQRGECWYWQGDGQDHLESLVGSLPVVIRADQLRALLAPSPLTRPAVPDAKAMANRLMGWKLPKNFSPDCFISFARGLAEGVGAWPVGTNLFTVDQATEMFEYVLAAAPQPEAQPTEAAQKGGA